MLGDDQRIMKTNTGFRHRHNRGVTFVELLVAVVIMSIGVLGVAALQAISLQQNRSALFRAEATQLANDILDRIRANPGGTYAPIDIAAAPASATVCESVECSIAQMAAYDISSWKCQLDSTDADGATYSICDALNLSSSLPDGKGGVTLAGSTYTVIIEWVDDREDNTKSITLRSIL